VIARAWIVWVLLGLVLGACSRDPAQQLVSQLDEPAKREQAIDGLLQLVRLAPADRRAKVKERVVRALIEAYEEDESRPEIVAALAVLRDPRAEEVFVAALRDADRGGTYYEAAVRSARLLGELGLHGRVPVLVEALRKAHASPRPDRNSWLERSLVTALDRLGDRQAVDVLVAVLKTDPVRQDFYLNKMAATALGRLGDPRAIRPLVASLAATSHGLLLFEESRRALCRLGQPTVAELLAAASRRDRRQQPEANAIAAARVLGDVGLRGDAPRVATLLKAKDPDDYRLAIAETLLRLGSSAGQATLREILASQQSALTARRQAAELLGWFGRTELASEILDTACAGSGAAQSVLCWSGALAYTRMADDSGLARIDAQIARSDATTQRYLQTYRPRLAVVATCAGDRDCYLRQLREGDWRAAERATLELAHQRDDQAAIVPRLARVYRKAHAQLKMAILVAIEQLVLDAPLSAADAAKISALLQPPRAAAGEQLPPPAIISRAICLGERLRRPR
jgi:HEAT repeat protein